MLFTRLLNILIGTVNLQILLALIGQCYVFVVNALVLRSEAAFLVMCDPSMN